MRGRDGPGFLRFDALFGLAFTLVFAYGCDYWIQRVREAASRSPNLSHYHLAAAGANVLLAVLLLSLVWLVHMRGKRSLVVAGVYTLAGLGFSLLPLALARAPAAFSFLFAPWWRDFRVTLLYSRPQSLLMFCSATVMVIGLAGLLPIKRSSLARLLGPF